MTCTRPDLCYVVTYLSQHLSKPLKTHYGMAKQVLRYLKGTPCRPLRFIKGSQPKLMGYSDSDWASLVIGTASVVMHLSCAMKVD